MTDGGRCVFSCNQCFHKKGSWYPLSEPVLTVVLWYFCWVWYSFSRPQMAAIIFCGEVVTLNCAHMDGDGRFVIRPMFCDHVYKNLCMYLSLNTRSASHHQQFFAPSRNKERGKTKRKKPPLASLDLLKIFIISRQLLAFSCKFVGGAKQLLVGPVEFEQYHRRDNECFTWAPILFALPNNCVEYLVGFSLGFIINLFGRSKGALTVLKTRVRFSVAFIEDLAAKA